MNSNHNERSSSSEEMSDSSSGFQNELLLNASYDHVFSPNLSMFDFMNAQPFSNIYSPHAYTKGSNNCRLTAALNNTPKSGTNYSASLEFREVVDRLPNISFNDESFAEFSANNSSFVGNFASNVRSTRLLPSWAVDENGKIRSSLTILDVVRNGSLIDFAMDRNGVKFLEKNYPLEAENEVHRLLFDKLTEQKSVFMGLCRSASGNFIIQKFVEYATYSEQDKMVDTMRDCGLLQMCLDKFACRVVQLAIQKFEISVSSKLVDEISKLDLIPLCTDQCAIHVIQKTMRSMPVDNWSFLVKFLCRDDNLMTVCQDKYGCRLVQQLVDKLSDNPKSLCFNTRLQLLHALMTSVARNCYRLSSNEFANYVVQYVIKSSGVMEMYRDTIIEKCLLRNLLSMSQDKYASHVVEGAFLFAPPKLLSEMMDEIFDGYVKDQETNRDALDILLFHQYGNYVIQQMISICISALLGKEERRLSCSEMRVYSKWFDRIKLRVSRHSSRLERFSSGKKIIESLQKLDSPNNEPLPQWALPSPIMVPSNTPTPFAQFANNSVFDD